MGPNATLMNALVLGPSPNPLAALYRLRHQFQPHAAPRAQSRSNRRPIEGGIATVRKRLGASGPWRGAVSGHGVRLSCSSARETREFVDGVDGLAGTCASLTLTPRLRLVNSRETLMVVEALNECQCGQARP